MLISEKYKYIYIDIPKTGCTAIQNYLLKHDKSCRTGGITRDGKWIRVDSHTKTKDLRSMMGKEAFDEYTVFTFIRNPYARGVSAYFFYKEVDRTRSSWLSRNIMARLNGMFTKMLPFPLWSLLKPQKKMVDYFFDEKKELLIDMVGKTENMNEDLKMICEVIGVPLNEIEVPPKNSSPHLGYEKYFVNRLHKKIYTKLLQDDIELYKKFINKIFTSRYRWKMKNKKYA